MKKIYMFAAAALMLAACSSNDKLEDATVQQQNLPDGAVGFDAYIQRGVTRAGWVGTVTASGLGTESADEADLGYHGFGVFGYYTDNNEYDPQSLPNFFYNQQVKYVGSSYTYDPIKYWPNEYGTNAISDDADKVTFFAYAPYVKVVPSTGKIEGTTEETKWGITGMSRNISGGDPLIKYIVSFDQDKMVDLCWGVCDDPNWATINDGNKYLNEGVIGKPWINVERPLKYDNTQRVKFTFKHALSQLNVTADTYADGTTAQSIDAKSRVYIRSITFTGFATKGTLNLNNETPNKAQWLDYNGTSELESGEEVTIYDGRKDGKEGTSGGIATNEKMLGLNPHFVQDENQIVGNAFRTYGDDPSASETSPSDPLYHSGVIGSPRNLFRKWDDVNKKYVEMAKADPVFVIPTGEKVKVTIVYDVETPSANLGVYLSDGKTPGSTIENRIEKEVDFGGTGMENGKKYTLHLHLGMNSVKFDASVDGWQDDYMTNDINLPSNAPEFAAAQNAVYEYSVPADAATGFAIKLTGFNGGEVITPTFDNTVGTPVSGAVGAQADATGVVNATFDISANNSVHVQKGWAKWAGISKQVQLNITQQAHALGLDATVVPSTTDIVLTSTASDIDWDADIDESNPEKFSVTRNGVALTYQNNTTPDAGKFYWNAANHKIVLNTGEQVAAGDVFIITVKAGDAPAETINRATKTTLTFAPTNLSLTYRTAHSYDLGDYLKNKTGAIDWDAGSETISDVGKLTYAGVGTVTVTAVDDMNTDSDPSDDGHATLNLKIEQQPLAITGLTAPTVTNKSVSDLESSTAVITTAFSASANGLYDTVTASISYVVTAKNGGDDVSGFTINGENKVVAPQGLAAGTYIITVTATATTADTHFSSKSEKVDFNFEVTTP